MKNLFGEEYQEPKKHGTLAKLNDYDNFVEKFKPKKTTDDCYTPQLVYDAVRQWVNDNIMSLDGVKIVRPFFPGGDYESYDYPDGCLVLDNPPFSILAKIKRFYHLKGVRYFLFAPALTLCSAKDLDCTYIVCGASITYENKAVVATSFVTNLPCDGTRVWCAGGLLKAIEQADKKNRKMNAPPEIPIYEYPPHVVTPALMQKISKRGINIRFPKDEVVRISTLDSQRDTGKSLFGGGWLISDRLAAERLAAERLAAERLAAERLAAERLAAKKKVYWPLSDKEKNIINHLNKNK